MKTIIERGASWTLDETKLLLSLWGQDFITRQHTQAKRTKEVYENISAKFNQNGFERTADQVRTRVFNMIAEYRRILKDPSPERMKKCIFFETLHKIYTAHDMDDIKAAIEQYELRAEYPYSPGHITDEDSEEESETNTTGRGQQASPHANAQSSTSNTNDVTNDNNNGDSNSTSIIEKESTTSSNTYQDGGGAHKKAKMESPKSAHDQATSADQSSAANASASTSSTNSSLDHHQTSSSSKQNKASSIPVGATATLTPVTSVALSSSSSSQRHQSLLLPHATTSSTSATSTPISKLATSGSNNTPSYINFNSAKLPIIRTNQIIGNPNGSEPINLNGTATRLPTTAAITSHQLYQAPVNTFDVTSSALLIDRMFAHLSRESENMREWIALEKERLALEKARRQQETEREVRRERVLIDTLMRFHEQWLTFLTRIDPRIVENMNESPPELRIPNKESGSSSGTSAEASQTQSSLGSSVNNSNPPSDANRQ